MKYKSDVQIQINNCHGMNTSISQLSESLRDVQQEILIAKGQLERIKIQNESVLKALCEYMVKEAEEKPFGHSNEKRGKK